MICPSFTVDDPLAARRHALVMGNDDDRDALLVEPGQDVQDLLARAAVEIARRLVGEQERRVVHERPRDGNALLLAPGELRRFMMQAIGKPDFFEQGDRPALCADARGTPL